MTPEQWDTLKATAPLIAIVISVIAILVSAGTAIYVSRFNAKAAVETALANARRADLIAGMQRYRQLLADLINYLHQVQLPHDARDAYRAAVEMKQELREKASFIYESSFHMEVERLAGPLKPLLQGSVIRLRLLKMYPETLIDTDGGTGDEWPETHHKWGTAAADLADELTKLRKDIETLLFKH